MAKRTRQQAGRYAQKKGLTFEGEIKLVNDNLFNRGIGRVWHAHAASKQQNGKIIWTARGPFDWFGLLDGKPVFFESKEVDFKRKAMPKRYTLPERNEHQLVALREALTFSPGSLCFVLMNWVLHLDGEIYAEMRLHPIQTIPDRTILREHGLLAVNRNWHEVAFAGEYLECSQQGFVQYEEEEDVPV